ncbi:tautomerase family protein [Prosthecomicrobium sp. N25]|uniref:tautomerase family protein n=1 Tax=Prosthecomicrobium sp. N25 TaxID=3129254 RepID=UPI003076B9A0
MRRGPGRAGPSLEPGRVPRPLVAGGGRAQPCGLQQEDVMPEIVVYLVEGRTIDQKRGLVKDITEAVTRNLQVPAENVVVQIVESTRDSKARGGVLFSDRG